MGLRRIKELGRLSVPFIAVGLILLVVALVAKRGWHYIPVSRSTVKEDSSRAAKSNKGSHIPSNSSLTTEDAALKSGFSSLSTKSKDVTGSAHHIAQIQPENSLIKQAKAPAINEKALRVEIMQNSGPEAFKTHSHPRTQVKLTPAPEPKSAWQESVLAPQTGMSAPESKTAPRIAPPQVTAPQRVAESSRPAPEVAAAVRAVRFDPSYYYGRGLSTRKLAEELTRSWSEQGVNLIYFYAYNRVYGARYQTDYAGNIMEDFGRQDLLGHLLRSAHSRGMEVVAWFYGPQHKQIWEAHPSWRQKTRDGNDYRPDADSYFLCVRNPEVMKWWLSLVDDLLSHYPDLDGIDLAEAQIVTWGDQACHCEHCRSQFAEAYPGKSPDDSTWHKFRAAGLTRLLLATSRLVHSYRKKTHITTVFTARPDGKLMTSSQVRDGTGFDLDAILASPDRPDIVQAELIWQQWADIYKNRSAFTPEWTRTAVNQAKAMIKGRARLIAHVEVTDFGSGGLNAPVLGRTIAAAVEAQPYGVDIYDSYQLDKINGAARSLQTAWLR